MNQTNDRNPLYPIFLKLHELDLLIVGAGEVGHEKLSFILKSSPEARITIVAPDISPKVQALLAEGDYQVNIHHRRFVPDDVVHQDLIIAATDIPELNESVRAAARAHRRLVNVADSPALCDFYLGSIVTKGQLKVAISTNGKSPTLAKRMRQMLEKVLPENINDLLLNLKTIRDRLQGDFAFKVDKLNEITASLVESEDEKVES